MINERIVSLVKSSNREDLMFNFLCNLFRKILDLRNDMNISYTYLLNLNENALFVMMMR